MGGQEVSRTDTTTESLFMWCQDPLDWDPMFVGFPPHEWHHVRCIGKVTSRKKGQYTKVEYLTEICTCTCHTELPATGQQPTTSKE